MVERDRIVVGLPMGDDYVLAEYFGGPYITLHFSLRDAGFDVINVFDYEHDRVDCEFTAEAVTRELETWRDGLGDSLAHDLRLYRESMR